MPMDYKQAGVDIAAGEALVNWLRQNPQKPQPHSERLVEGLGGFAALFRADFKDMQEPCLVSCTDGVGTKLKVAVHFDQYQGVGQDLVAMCVNDLICVGALPLFFLDYYATGRLELEAAKSFLKGVSEACTQSDCALIGGETAEMPGVYSSKDFDCAGFSVGIVDRAKALGRHRVTPGQVILGVSSSGFHSNGYSLLRKVFAEDIDAWREVLLRPTALYVSLAKQLFQENLIEAIAHITGGGLDNLSRVLPQNTKAELKLWPIPEIFREVQKRAELSEKELLKTLNCGLGLALIVSEDNAEKVRSLVLSEGFKCFELGNIQASDSPTPTWHLGELSGGGH